MYQYGTSDQIYKHSMNVHKTLFIYPTFLLNTALTNKATRGNKYRLGLLTCTIDDNTFVLCFQNRSSWNDPIRMTLLQVCLVVLLISGSFRIQASPTKSLLNENANHSSHTEEKSLERREEIQTHNQTHNSNESESNVEDVGISDRIIVPLEAVVASLGQNTLVELTNLQLSIPADLRLGDINPDFSRMVLKVNSTIESLDIDGDYILLIRNIAILPFYNRGHIYVNLRNVTVTGRTVLALTPAALLSLHSDFAFTPQEVNARVVPMSEITSAEEVYLSKDVVSGTLAALIGQKLEAQLNYHVSEQINLALSQISVFTIGHKNSEMVTKEQLTQNVQIGDLFDEMLVDAKKEIVENQNDEIGVPSFHRNFSEKLESVIVNGTFSAVEGWLLGVSSFKRSSNVSLSKSEEIFILSAILEFDNLVMGYDKYVATFLKTNVTGKLEGKFLHRQIMIKVAMNPNEDGTCTSTLYEIKFFKVNGYRIQEITNIGSFDWLQMRINNWLIGFFQTKIVKVVEKVLATALRSSLSRFDCGEYIPSFKILQ